MLVIFKKLFAEMILLADKNPTFYEKVIYAAHCIMAFAPIAFMLNGLGAWFEDNQKFCRAGITVLLINMIVGVVYHHKMKSFDWELFIKRNSMMIAVVVVVYILLEQLRLTAGENFAGEAFKIVIQCATILWPISKALKNVYILTNKQHPPAFIMDRLYNFEKTGNVSKLFESDERAAEHYNENENTVQ